MRKLKRKEIFRCLESQEKVNKVPSHGGGGNRNGGGKVCGELIF